MQTTVRKKVSIIALGLSLMVLYGTAIAQGQAEEQFVREGQIVYGDMDSWWSRKVKESVLIGGDEVIYFEPGPSDTEYQGIAGTLSQLTPWATSNIRAEIGVTSANQSVYREARGKGYCARLETNLKKVVVLGIVNVKAIASGSIFTGKMEDPITQSDQPMRNTFMGIEFRHAPTSISFDYKVHIGQKRLKATGGLKVRAVDGPDMAEAYAFFQSRREDAQGNLLVNRVGTAWKLFAESQEQWVDGYEMPVVYGDVRKHPEYIPYVDLISKKNPYYTLNSKGEVISYFETGWSDQKEDITHVIILFSSSYEGGAYVGSPESKLWIDNIRFNYE